MNKLVAVFSSVAVCVSAVAVSVLSYFSHSVKTDAAAPNTSSLVTTSLSDSGSYPYISIPINDLVNATSDFFIYVYFCPSGWQSPNTAYVSPSSYGTYDSSFYFYCYLKWRVSDHRFVFSFLTHFDVNHDGQKIFSNLHFTNIWGNGGLNSRDIIFSAVSPVASASTNAYFYLDGDSFDPSALTNNVVFTLKGLIGNNYDLYLSSRVYSSGYGDGYTHGYDSGYFGGLSVGNSIGYGNGEYIGYSNGVSAGYSNGYSVGVQDASSQFGMWDLFSNAFGAVGNVLGIQIFPGFTVGLLISVPIAFAFILWLIHVLKS